MTKSLAPTQPQAPSVVDLTEPSVNINTTVEVTEKSRSRRSAHPDFDSLALIRTDQTIPVLPLPPVYFGNPIPI